MPRGKILLWLVANVIIIGLLFEGTLRIMPRLIPASLLLNFSPAARAAIAPGRFSTLADTAPLSRTDGGPPLRIRQPRANAFYQYSDPGSVNEVTMDEMGFCNPPDSYQPDRINIIALGDSFTWCTTVHPENAWPAQLSALGQTKTYNLGTPATGLNEHLLFLEQFGLAKQPEKVIMNIYEGNDLRDADRFWRYRRHPVAVDSEPVGLLKIKQKLQQSRIGRHSYAFNLLLSSAQLAYRSLPQNYDRSINYRFKIDADQPIDFNLDNTDTDEIKYARRWADNEISFQVFDEALESFARLAREHDFSPVLTYTPTAATAYEEIISYADQPVGESLRQFSQAQRQYFKLKAEELGVDFLDLTPAMQAAAPNHATIDNLLYFPTNLHLTSSGHEVIARYLADKIVASREQ